MRHPGAPQSIFLTDFESFDSIFKNPLTIHSLTYTFVWLNVSNEPGANLTKKKRSITTQKPCEINTPLYRKRTLRLRDTIQITRLEKLGFDPGLQGFRGHAFSLPAWYVLNRCWVSFSLSLTYTHNTEFFWRGVPETNPNRNSNANHLADCHLLLSFVLDFQKSPRIK